MTGLEKISEQLQAIFNEKDRPDVEVLSRNQLMIRKNMVLHPMVGSGQKVQGHIPGKEGYQIHIVCNEQAGSKDRPPQREVFPSQPEIWDPTSMTLQMDRKFLSSSWKLVNKDGEVISVAVDCGSSAVFEEVDRILEILADTLF
jgi:hypothetical protein